jgi:hypothetical protein
MPIQFPQPKQDNPLDRWKWMTGAKPPARQNQPNLSRPGFPFGGDHIATGLNRPQSIAANLYNPGSMFRNDSGAVVNPYC